VLSLANSEQVYLVIAIISRGTDTMSLAANLFAQALIAQFDEHQQPL
jgi:hypothetical protein